ncbi:MULTISPECIES: hypothetical protein [unclassified Methanoculleus]|uniref:Uncharacterized protein n=1 Tax=Methanoculleus palmolei TaxID=72612 RepID=A0ABD8AAH6_9EURY|nr:hypothetical protein [Methanoculleus sp. UBA377]MDD2473502.1 hypothetical protein [Methanoculleus sp.]WOX56544.1 hypothetical protein R6Y95_04215 [Methanoculleus palmolei]
MKPVACRGPGILLIGLCLLLIFAAGCLVPEYGVGRDIMVFKVDAGGTEQWQTVIDTGGDDRASCIVQTADGGYLIGGEVWPWRGDQSYGIFKIDDGGSVAWNATGRGSPVSSVAETTRGAIVAVGESGVLLLDPAGEILESDVEADSILQSVVGTAAGGFVAAGTDGKDFLVLKRDRNLTEEWRKTYGSTTGAAYAKIIIQTSDGGYLVGGPIYLPDRTGSDVWILRLNATGDLLWNATLGTPLLYNDVHFMSEALGGECTVIYNNVTLEEVIFDPEGNVLEERTLNASTPIIKTIDEGYVSGTVTYRSASRFLILPDRVGVPHVMKLNADGLPEWDTELNATFELLGDAVSVIQTTDGGYAFLMNRHNYPREPR